MKKLIFTMFALFICSVSHAQTETMNWYVEGALYDTTTCESGGDIDLPTSPTKYGYTFQGWYPYVPLEYIEFTGIQYIQVSLSDIQSYSPSSYIHSKIRLSVSQLQSMGIVNNAIIVWLSGSTFCVRSTSGTQFCSNIRSEIQQIYDIEYILDSTKSILIVNDTTYQANSIYKQNNKIVTLGNNEAGLPYSKLYGKIYNYKAFDGNDNLLLDMVPALDSNNIACMYDKVSETFFYNQGTGDFIAGPIKTSIEEE